MPIELEKPEQIGSGNEAEPIQNIQKEIQDYISDKIGKLARPKSVHIISDMPKTRTGKVMRRLLRSKLLGESLGDLSGLENPHVLDEII